MSEEKDILLEIKDLTIHYVTDDGTVRAVNNISLEVGRGETLGLVGETGAGKTTTALGIMRLVPNPPGRVIGGEINFLCKSDRDLKAQPTDLLKAQEKSMRRIRGEKISMIFQDPMTALNPVFTVGEQIAEVIRLHDDISNADAWKKAEDVLEMVGIPAARSKDYPHQFSGGMKQRIVIAIALACNPELLIADEPTTALDVTIQAQVLEMMDRLKSTLGTSMIMITHDLGIIAEMCDKVAIIYAGQIVEQGDLVHIFDEMKHPYTIGLFGSLPNVASTEGERLKPIPGLMPDPANLPQGCKFSPRCPYATERCHQEEPELIDLGDKHLVRCFKVQEEMKKGES